MAASPRWKVYLDGEYRASCRYPEDAAMLVACLGDGAQIRDGHAARSIVWNEGAEEQPAGESYDYVAAMVWHRTGAEGRRVDA